MKIHEYYQKDGNLYSVISWNYYGGELCNSLKQWCKNGQLHREDGPAIERDNGDKEWFLNGDRHRKNGPAVEWTNGDKEWWLHGELVTEEVVMANRVRTFLKKAIK